MHPCVVVHMHSRFSRPNPHHISKSTWTHAINIRPSSTPKDSAWSRTPTLLLARSKVSSRRQTCCSTEFPDFGWSVLRIRVRTSWPIWRSSILKGLMKKQGCRCVFVERASFRRTWNTTIRRWRSSNGRCGTLIINRHPSMDNRIHKKLYKMGTMIKK